MTFGHGIKRLAKHHHVLFNQENKSLAKSSLFTWRVIFVMFKNSNCLPFSYQNSKALWFSHLPCPLQCHQNSFTYPVYCVRNHLKAWTVGDLASTLTLCYTCTWRERAESSIYHCFKSHSYIQNFVMVSLQQLPYTCILHQLQLSFQPTYKKWATIFPKIVYCG